jgi:primosomal protein N'
MFGYDHPSCPECDAEISGLEDREAELGIADGCEWEVAVEGDCPECGEPLYIYASTPGTYRQNE